MLRTARNIGSMVLRQVFWQLYGAAGEFFRLYSDASDSTIADFEKKHILQS